MSYIINKTDGTVLTTIQDGTIDTSTSLTLVGRGSTSFGEKINENFIKMLESGANTSAPTAPLVGQLWFDKSTSSLKVYTGSSFKPISSSFASNTEPTTSNVGDLWLDTANSQLKIYTSTGYVLVGPTYTKNQGITGIFAGNIVDSSSTSHVVANIYVQGALIGVLSDDASYLPSAAISGFTTIEPGLTLNANITSDGFIGNLIGSASELNGITDSQFARVDEETTFANAVTISSDNGLTIGSSSALSITKASNDMFITNNIEDGDTKFSVNVAGTITTALTIDGLTGLVTVADDPSNDLGVATKQYVDTEIATVTGGLGSANSLLALKANIASPALTGVPTAPTASAGTNTTQLATTQFVTTAINNIPEDSELWKGADKFVSTSAPTSGDGEDGDIWIQV